MNHGNQPLGGNGETPREMVEKLSKCRMLPGSGAKYFLRNMVLRMNAGTLDGISPKQLEYLRKLRYAYREQIGDDGKPGKMES